MSTINPFNHYILIEKVREEVDNTFAVLVPDEYKKQELYGLYKVLEAADDVRLLDTGLLIDDQIVVLNSMVEEVKIKGKSFKIVQENHVVGIYSDIRAEDII